MFCRCHRRNRTCRLARSAWSWRFAYQKFFLVVVVVAAAAAAAAALVSGEQ